MKPKLTKVQQELLDMLAQGPRYGFTRFRVINALVEKGLARKIKAKNTYGQPSFDWVITAAGKKLVTPRRPFDQHSSQDAPGFVETFRVHP